MFKHVPNILTIIRFLLIPFIVFFIFQEQYIMAFVFFTISGITDVADGFIARKFNFITNFGKLMDPLADKLLVSSALIALIQPNRIAAWIVIVIIAREFIISGFRLIAADNGIVIAANIFGKIKTVTQMFMIIILVANIPLAPLQIVGEILKWVALVMTILSLVIYIYQNSAVLKEQN